MAMDDVDVPQYQVSELPDEFGGTVVLHLVRNGFDAVNVVGGMAAWAASGRPVVTDDGSPGTI